MLRNAARISASTMRRLSPVASGARSAPAKQPDEVFVVGAETRSGARQAPARSGTGADDIVQKDSHLMPPPATRYVRKRANVTKNVWSGLHSMDLPSSHTLGL